LQVVVVQVQKQVQEVRHQMVVVVLQVQEQELLALEQ
tara:strand:+ start:350 stop:460 length:111 start_codon:yes stop_codon:yes gene_type:complete